MKRNRRIVATAAGITALAAGGAGIAYGVAGESDERPTGPGAERAKRAALEAVGGGSVSEIERQDGDGAGAFEVEVRRADGSQVEVHVDRNYNVVGQSGDDDGPGETEGSGEDEGGGAEDD
ncbi:MAG: PepSY domain-containing protein [Thermoleophilaceae bacterium]|nr:PepSY domain-containing protein [Thermoleophilaceae bacterium]